MNSGSFYGSQPLISWMRSASIHSKEKGDGKMEGTDVKKIFVAEDNLQAEMILEALRSVGIPAYKKDADGRGFLNTYGANSLCGEEIYIPAEEKKQAEEVLENMGLKAEE